MPLIIICFWIALGAKELIELKPINKKIFSAIVIILITTQIGLNFTENDESRNDIYVRFAKNVLNSLPKNTILLIEGDIFINSLIYTQFCLNVRPDIKILNIGRMKGSWYTKKVKNTYPEINFPRAVMVPIGMDPKSLGVYNGFTFSEFVYANKNKFPVYTNLHYIALKSERNYIDLWPLGLVSEVERRGIIKSNISALMQKSKAQIYKFEMPRGYIPTKGSQEEIIKESFENALETNAMQLTDLVIKNRWDRNIINESAMLQNERINNFPNATYQNYKNLGFIYGLIPGTQAFEKKIQAFHMYLKMAPETDRGYARIKRIYQNATVQKKESVH
jgi:hypothetical protein